MLLLFCNSYLPNWGLNSLKQMHGFGPVDTFASICCWIGSPMSCVKIVRDPSLLYIESDLRTFCWQPLASHTWNTLVLIYIVTVSTDFSTLILTLKWDPTNLFRNSVVSPVLPTKKLRKRRHKFLVKVHTQRIKRAKIQTKYGILLLHYEVLCKFKSTCPSSTPY